MTGRLEACIRLSKKIGLKGKTLLDIGCSNGWFLDVALKEGAKKVYAIEPENEKLQLAKKNNPEAIITKGVAGELNFPKNQFDIVTLFDVIEHVPLNSELQVFNEINKVLKPKGHLLLSTPFQSVVSMFGDPAWYFGHRHYSRNKLTTLLNEANFKVTSVEVKGGIWEVLAIWVLYSTKWILHISMPFEEWFDKKRRKEFSQEGYIEIFVTAEKI